MHALALGRGNVTEAALGSQIIRGAITGEARSVCPREAVRVGSELLHSVRGIERSRRRYLDGHRFRGRVIAVDRVALPRGEAGHGYGARELRCPCTLAHVGLGL